MSSYLARRPASVFACQQQPNPTLVEVGITGELLEAIPGPWKCDGLSRII